MHRVNSEQHLERLPWQDSDIPVIQWTANASEITHSKLVVGQKGHGRCAAGHTTGISNEEEWAAVFRTQGRVSTWQGEENNPQIIHRVEAKIARNKECCVSSLCRAALLGDTPPSQDTCCCVLRRGALLAGLTRCSGHTEMGRHRQTWVAGRLS